jgi:GrpB-like predicted nucleotidyltransferase (UPF0157 family)
MGGDPVRFERSDAAATEVVRIVADVRRDVVERLPGADLRLTGGSSIPGVLTRGDIDLHLRVPVTSMAESVAFLAASWRSVNKDMWTDAFATFERTDRGRAVGIAVTTIDGEHDRRFRHAWRRLRRDPALLERYGSMKRACAGGDEDAYRRAKGAFFADLDVMDDGPVFAGATGTPVPPELGVAAIRALTTLGIEELEDAARWRPEELVSLDDVDRATIRTLEGALAAHGLTFRGPR